ncbi:MAG: NRAMP family Mn2+/Fe2+ transporter [Candidatus Collierbacteria bacterium GW2011_GWD2_45_10]|nr:MAG: NRAMP family Mn2+/Fe2+ transporter [Candidatus Collierbacteria bacterium GW2011_GWA2_44_13]KKT62483.1 MAG: NRAMP family Mn2+/Fe2+ transporter [Candidatus Collierbacteria bacterium GW2011_GWD1_44_27]KKT88732.1 MAG: NRAMP family Mn2+/Fe2+ transporter [Candidatus Collierbacteria bacterium GW2011_GWD2_45_10]
MLKRVGPGFITGAADDDPSGVATYSIAGAQYGYKMSWMSLFLLPAMISIQEMCGRIGLVTGSGLAAVIKKFYSVKLMWFAVSLLAVANVINIGADLGIIAASLQMLFGLPFHFWLIVTAVLIVWMEIAVTYKKYARVLKWLGLSLLVYVITAFMVKQNWGEIAFMILVPHIDFNLGYLMTMVGFMGTTISPYLFFWQTSEEVEEKITDVRSQISDFGQKTKVWPSDVKRMRWDTKIGMLFSNLMTFFIVLTTAATLHKNGVFNISTPQEAALALKPLAGDFAYLLFAFGMIGIGLQSIPVLAGSLAYAVADGLGIPEGLSKKFHQARGFYIVIALATLVGAGMNMVGVNTMQALYVAAVVNGVIAVPLIFIIIKLADDNRVVGDFKTQKRYKLIAWITFVFMALSVLFMLGSLLFK